MTLPAVHVTLAQPAAQGSCSSTHEANKAWLLSSALTASKALAAEGGLGGEGEGDGGDGEGGDGLGGMGGGGDGGGDGSGGGGEGGGGGGGEGGNGEGGGDGDGNGGGGDGDGGGSGEGDGGRGGRGGEGLGGTGGGGGGGRGGEGLGGSGGEGDGEGGAGGPGHALNPASRTTTSAAMPAGIVPHMSGFPLMTNRTKEVMFAYEAGIVDLMPLLERSMLVSELSTDHCVGSSPLRLLRERSSARNPTRVLQLLGSVPVQLHSCKPYTSQTYESCQCSFMSPEY